MGVKISKINEVKGNLRIRALLERKTDFKLLQALFRDCISSRLCVESAFGLDENFEDFPEFIYPVNIAFDLIYEAATKRVALAYVTAKLR